MSTTNKILNFADFQRGSVLRVFYFLTLGRFRKIFNFVGICKLYNNKSCAKTFTLQNYYGKELLEINFIFKSPYIIFIHKMNDYNFEAFTKNLHYLNNYRLAAHLPFYAPPVERSYDPYDFIYSAVTSLGERRRLRRKFRL